MDRPALIQTHGSVWITCVLVWIKGMDRAVQFDSQPYIASQKYQKWENKILQKKHIKVISIRFYRFGVANFLLEDTSDAESPWPGTV